MKPILSAAQMKACDQATITSHGVPSLVLMERAALAVTAEIKAQFPDTSTPVAIICGSGNNGGDGVAIGRMLYLAGYPVQLLVLGNAAHYTTQLQAEIDMARSYGVPFVGECQEFTAPGIIVDAIFGIGLSRPVEGQYAHAITYINSSAAYTLAVDIPSGFSADTGVMLGAGVQADCTVTFAYEKLCLYLSDCAAAAGRIVTADVGIYLSSTDDCCTHLFAEDLQFIPRRAKTANKGTCGRVLVIAGSADIYGACYLSARAAMVAGSGLVKVYTHENNRAALSVALPEAMYEFYDSFDPAQLDSLMSWPDVILIGPGLSTTDISRQIFEYLVSNVSKPLVIDADGINLLSQRLDLLNAITVPVILTPHLKEMSRLCGLSVSEINNSMVDTADSFAKKYHCSLVLKNYATVIACQNHAPYICTSGNEALATAGSGDVLAGIIASLLGQGLSPEMAASLGALLHGHSGASASDDTGIRGLLASDIISHLES